MSNYEARKQSASQFLNQLIAQSIDDPFKQAIALWEAGYSLRIIQEITDVHRSKLSRYINENDLERDDDKRTQNRKNRVYQCRKLHQMGFSREEIAQELDLNPRTIDSYFKEIGIKSKTKIKEMEK